jgi:predicted DNA-binding protein
MYTGGKPMQKVLKSFRLSLETLKNLENLAKYWNVTQSEVLTILISAANLGDYDRIDEMIELARKL